MIHTKDNESSLPQIFRDYIKIRKRNIMFRLLRRKIGVDDLAFQLYELQGEVLELKDKINQLIQKL